MSQEKSRRPRPWRSSVDHEEERAWVNFYRRVGDPDIAVEVMHQLEADPEMKRAHLALYMQCKETLRKHLARQARDKRIGQAVRSLCVALFVRPLGWIGLSWSRALHTAEACLPEERKEPAVGQVDRLAKKPAYAQEKAEFAGSAASQAAPMTPIEPAAAEKVANAAVKNS